MDEYRLRWSPPAIRQLDRLAETSPRIPAAVIEFCFGRLVENPRRIGHPLARELTGWYAARVGAYRVVHWIDEDDRVVYVDRVDHRSVVYRRQ